MKINKLFFDSLPSFETYHQHIQHLLENGKTTGDNQSETMLNYTKLSITRLNRGLKTFECTEELIEAAKNTTHKNWVVISEAWCGDAGNIIPIFELLARQIPTINLKVMLRDTYPEVMAEYLTNGGKSIPIFIAFDDQFNEEKHWGPRPAPAQQMVLDNKISGDKSHDEFAIDLQKWYIQDKTETLQKEIATYLESF